VDLTEARYTYILHSDQSFHSSCNPCQRTRSTKGCEVWRDLEMVVCPPHCRHGLWRMDIV